MIPSSHIQFCKELCPNQLIQNFLNDLHRETIFNSQIILLPIMHTKSPTTILFLYQ
jgi:hypothetical protein